MKKVLDASNITSDVQQVQALHSHESVGIQLADVLTAYEKNDISNILNAPDFVRNERYFGKDKA